MHDGQSTSHAYYDFDQATIDLAKEILAHAEAARDLLDALAAHPGSSLRCLDVARTSLQRGFNAAARAITVATTS
ncbi:MAG: hypothetical protein IT518_14660 [Burkholderiales bacterium]|nr:hypothetical protein [Burkholderiales bacterium]